MCRCAYERGLDHNYQKTRGKEDKEHEYPLRIAEEICDRCKNIENDLYVHGYLKRKSSMTKIELLMKISYDVPCLMNDKKLKTNNDVSKYLWKNLITKDDTYQLLENAGYDEFKDYIDIIIDFYKK